MARPKIVRDGYKQNTFLPVRGIAIAILKTRKDKHRSFSACIHSMILEHEHEFRQEEIIAVEMELIKNRRSPYAKKDQPNRP